MTVKNNNVTFLTRIYAGSRYMKENSTSQYTYLGGDAYTAPVVAKTSGGNTNYYYLLRDYLGNITHLVNASNTVEAEYSFDAWGRRRNPSDWSYDLTNQPDLIAGRGFTGHEHLPWFNLINMNGRLYDPQVGRFLNADNNIQDPLNTQNYNRYSYCLNNPLRFVDPSGNSWGSILTGIYLLGATVATILCPPAGLAMFGAYIGGAQANHWQLNFGSWNWKDPGTYLGIVMGGALGYVGGYGLANPGSVGLSIKAGILGLGDVGLSMSNNNFSLQWDTSAGGGGNYDLSGTPKTSPAQKVDQAIAKAQGQGGYNVDDAVNSLNENSYSSYAGAKEAGNGASCARYIRYSLESGFGLQRDAFLGKAPGAAREYGPFLESLGFNQTYTTDYLKGDFAVFQGYPGGTADRNGIPYGHIQEYNGTQWISNYYQNSFWPGLNYQKYQPSLQIYRWRP